MVPGQVINGGAIDFMRKLDVKEIHGFERSKGLKLIRADHAKESYSKIGRGHRRDRQETGEHVELRRRNPPR